MNSTGMHTCEKKIFIHEETCCLEDGTSYTVTNLTYRSCGVRHNLVMFSDGEGFPEFIKTNKRLVPDDWFDEDYEGSYQDEENTDDNETGSTSGADAG